MLIQKIARIFSKLKKSHPASASLPVQPKKLHSSLKPWQRMVYVMLLVISELSQVATPFAYANQSTTPPPLPPEKKNATLLTDTTAYAPIPFIGEGNGVDSVVPALTNTTVSNTAAVVRGVAKVRKLVKQNYRPNEDIAVVIDNGANDKYKTELIDANGAKVALQTDEVVIGDTKTIKVSQPSSFRPGKYKLRISNSSGGVSEQDFTWGVLAINPDKSVYTPGETANLAMAVLNDKGDMVCDANVDLKITNPAGQTTDLSTDNKKINVNPECLSHDFTLNPDYDTSYQVSKIGTYSMTLQASSPNGSYTITDSFDVRSSVPFDVKRVTATRIYPPHTYPVTMEITANQDFNGTVTETLPAGFQVAKPGQDITPSNQFNPDPTASDSAVVAASDVQAPEVAPAPALPNASLIAAYSTISNLPNISGSQAVLGASTTSFGMPFAGDFPVTQGFGDSLVNIHDESLYKEFGMAGHDGIDFGVPIGTPIISVDAGTVVLAGPGDYGTTIVVQHAWGKSYYGHLSRVDVKIGDQVLRGSPLGLSGNSGITTGPHLHFGIKPENSDMKNGYYGKVDPAYYLGLKQSAGNVLGASTSVNTAAAQASPVPAQTISAQVSTDVQILTWKVNVKKGDKFKIGYNYLAPRISPQFYTLGPATFHDTSGKDVFHEQRKWQIAADAMDLKFKQGSFAKSTCTATCTQSIGGLGFRPKAVIFRWTLQTTQAIAANQLTGMGFATANGGTVQERAVSYWSTDAAATSATGRRRSDTKSIVMQTTGGTLNSEADFVSMDNDGFTLSWTTNSASAYIIQYTAIGGADVTNAKAGTFSLTTGTGSLAVTDPGFQPDFVMTLATGNNATVDDVLNTNTTHAKMDVGFAKDAAHEASATMLARSGLATSDTYRQQRTDATILLLKDASGAQDAVADFTSMDATGFTLNKSDGPDVATSIFYLALQGGQYDVGALTQPTANGSQAVTTGFKPSGAMFASTNTTTGSTITTTGALSVGGASQSKQSRDAWCNDTSGITCTTAWSNRRKITIDNSASSSTLNDFPILVKIDSTRIDYNKTQSDGDDLRFVDPNNPNLVLSHEIEGTWANSGTNYVWVKIPQLDASAGNYIWMYYGNAAASSGQDASNVWDSSTFMNQHLEETAACSTTFSDSTANAQNGSCLAGGPAFNSSGQIGSARTFNGTVQYISIANNSGFNPGTASFTGSLWVKMTASPGTYQAFFSHQTPSGAFPGWTFYTGSGICGSGVRICLWDGTNDIGVLSGMVTSTWTHVAFVKSGTTATFYVNGVSVGTATAASSIPTSSAGISIGSDAAGGGGGELNGSADEVRYSQTARSADWIKAEYLTETDAMNTFGAEETQSSIANQISEGSIWSDDLDNEGTENANMSTTTSKAISMAASPTGGAIATITAEADLQSFDPTGFTLNWTTTDATAREVLYWAAGSVDASEEDYRWYKNANNITPSNAMDDENQPAILAKSSPYARLRTNISTSGNGLNAASQGFKLQYASANGPSGTAPTSDWCNATGSVTCSTDWTVRRKITFDNSASTSNLTDFPVLVKLDKSRIDYNKTQNSGQDLRFVDPSDPTVVLPHQIEKWDETGTSYVWVKVPQVNLGSTTDSIWMYYGNASAADGQVPTSVWDTNFKGVWHLNESGNGTAGEFKDSTSNAFNARGGNGTAGNVPAQTAAKIANGQTFDGVSDFINIPHTATLEPANISISAWANFTSLTTYDAIVSEKNGDGYNLALNDDSSPANTVDFLVRANGAYRIASFSTATLSPGTWYHIEGTYDGTTVKLYINGALVASTTTTGSITYGSVGDVQIGAEGGAGATPDSGAYLGGVVDDARISNTARSADWVKAEYLTENDSMNSFSDEMPYTQGGTSASGWIDVADPWCNATTGITCNTAWSNRKRITIDNSASGTNLTDFPVLVKLDSSRIDYSKTQNSGQDIRFVDPSDPTVVLPHEIESWNESGTSYVWVKVPQLDAGSATDSIWMYYGNASVLDGQAPTSVWDSNYKIVQHLEETGACAVTFTDSTSSGNNGSCSATPANGTGKIGNGRDFVTSDSDFIKMPASSTFNTQSPDLTVGTWFKTTNTASEGMMISIGNASSTGVQLFIESGTGLLVGWSSTGNQFRSPSSVADGQWHYAVESFDGVNGTLYLDGVQITQAARTFANSTLDAQIGAQCSGAGSTTCSSYYTGSLDEIRVSANARSADWIKAEYLTQNDSMNTFGSEETQTSAEWRFRDNTSVTNATTITSKLLAGSTAGNQQTYQEANYATNPTAMAAGERREWDWSLDGTNTRRYTTYYFRVVTADGTPLTNYTRYPTLTMGPALNQLMRHGKWFNYGKSQPFTF